MSAVVRREITEREFKAEVEGLAECVARALYEVQCDATVALVALEMVARSIRSATERQLLSHDGAFAEFEQQIAEHFGRLKQNPLKGES